jgi:hypothetical protein
VSEQPARQTNGADAYGKTVWSWHPLLVSNRRRCCEPNRVRKTFNPPMTVTRRIRRRGERGISRKTIAQGRRNAPTVPVCSCALAIVFCTRDRGCSKHPAFPAPSSLGAKRFARPGRKVSRECGGVVCRHCERSEAIHRAAQRKNGLLRRFAPRNDVDKSAPHIRCRRPRMRAIQYSRDVSDGAEKPQRTGYPACAGYDSGGWEAAGAMTPERWARASR